VEREDETLIEMRLYVPPGHALPGVDMDAAAEAAREKAKARAAKHGGAKKAGSAGSSAEEGGSAEDGEDEDAGGGAGTGDGAANVLHSLVSDAAGIAGVSGEAIAELPEEVGQFLVPRGRYAVELYPTFMRLIGKTCVHRPRVGGRRWWRR
jgi:structure-specific recognition protein 1